MSNNNIIWNHWVPFPGYVAITLFGRVLSRPRYSPLSVHTLRHEYCHILQQREYGLKFYWIYFRDWLRYGYKNVPFEVSAREYASSPDTEDFLQWYRSITNNRDV